MVCQVLQQRPAYSTPRMSGMNRHLLDMGVAVNPVANQIGHRLVSLIDRHPGATGALILQQHLHGQRFVVSDLRHPDVPKTLSGCALDVLQALEFIYPGHSDTHRDIIRPPKACAGGRIPREFLPRPTGRDSVEFDRYHSVEPLSYGVLPDGMDVYGGEPTESSCGLPGDLRPGPTRAQGEGVIDNDRRAETDETASRATDTDNTADTKRNVLGVLVDAINAPLPEWMRGPFRPLLGEYLGRAVLERQGYLRFDQIDLLVRRHLSGAGEHGRELWAALMLSMWAEKHKAYR